MRKLDENCVYSLEDLTSEEHMTLHNWLLENDECWDDTTIKDFIRNGESFNLHYKGSLTWHWIDKNDSNTTRNAKELFYTLENVQVDCANETEERINDMFEVVRNKDFQIRTDALTTERNYVFFRQEITGNKFGLFERVSEKTTITYEKFMELFAEPQYEVKYIAGQPKEETFNPQQHYNNDKGSLYKVAQDRNWNAYLFDVVKRLERGGKKDPLEQEIQKSIDVLKLWLIEATQ